MSDQHWTAEENHNYDPAMIIRYNPTPGGKKNADGSTSHSLSFPALQITHWVADKVQAAADVAEALNEYPRLQAENAELSARFDLRAHLARQREFSERTFGPGARVKGVVDHIRKELAEIEANPGDLSEWIDVVILALDGAWRAGHDPDAIIAALVAKQTKNEARSWPDWRTAEPGRAIEHDRAGDDMPAEEGGGSRTAPKAVPSNFTAVAWITTDGLRNWLGGQHAEAHILLRERGAMRVPLYVPTSEAESVQPAQEVDQ